MIITRVEVPCWYELSWNSNGQITLRVHEDFVKNKGNISKEAPVIVDMKVEHKLNIFEGDFSGKNFGFDKSFVNKGLNKSFFEMMVELPVLRKKSDEPCFSCNGTGKDNFSNFSDEICKFCNGECNSYFYDWEKVFAISASFTVFFMFAFNFEREILTSSNKKQLMTVQTMTKRDAHGGSLYGEFSSLLVNWLRRMANEENQNFLTTVRKAAMVAYTRMDNRALSYFDEYNFRIMMKNGRLIIDCPGDACGIYPEEWNENADEGYEFNCHNVDNPMQQLTLLAGLAALHDEARKAGI